MKAEPQREHQWLQQLVGEWTYESDCYMGPDQPRMKSEGSESVRTLGGLWVIAEGRGTMPDGDPATMVMTIGYDPQKGYVGTWIGSMMTKLWHYDGEMDASGKILTLTSEGPSFASDGTTSKYQDIVEVVNEDHRIFRSQVLGQDGNWTEFMRADYRRKK